MFLQLLSHNAVRLNKSNLSNYILNIKFKLELTLKELKIPSFHIFTIVIIPFDKNQNCFHHKIQ